MGGTLIAIVLAPLAKEAIKLLVSLAAAMVVAVAFSVSSVAAVLGVVPVELSGSSAAAETAGAPVTTTAGLPTPGVIELARAQIGRPYVWGGASPATSFDCSGLVQWTYGQLGLKLPRTAQQQFNATARVSRSDLQPGDLLFFANTYPSFEPITHVGIYIGDGQMINAPTVGAYIREEAAFSGFWGAHYASAGRVVG